MNPVYDQDDFFLPDALIWAFKLYARNFISLLALAIIGVLPSWIYQITVAIPLSWEFNAGIFMQVASFLFAGVFYLALIRAMVDIQEGVDASFVQLLKSGLKKLWPLMGLFLILLFSTAVLSFIYWGLPSTSSIIFIILLLPFKIIYWLLLICLGMVATFCPYVLVIQDAGIKETLKTCLRIIHKYFWRSLLGFLLLIIMASLVTFPFLLVLVLLRAHDAVYITVTCMLGAIYMPFAVGYFLRFFKSYEKVVHPVET